MAYSCKPELPILISKPFIQLSRDKTQLEARLKDNETALIEEEDKGKALAKQKVKLETIVNELEDKLQKEEKVESELYFYLN